MTRLIRILAHLGELATTSGRLMVWPPPRGEFDE